MRNINVDSVRVYNIFWDHNQKLKFCRILFSRILEAIIISNKPRFLMFLGTWKNTCELLELFEIG